MFCPKCGNKLAEGASFCGKCGAAIPSGSSSVAATPAPSSSDIVATAISSAASLSPRIASGQTTASGSYAAVAVPPRQTLSDRLRVGDARSKPLFILGLLLPPIALLVFLFLRTRSPERAESLALGGAWGCVLWVLAIAAAYAVYLVQAIGYYNSFM